jgi:hypothetical protein
LPDGSKSLIPADWTDFAPTVQPLGAIAAKQTATFGSLEALLHASAVLVIGLSAEEVISTRKETRRQALLGRMVRLLRSGQCLWPPHEILRLLISAHAQNSADFDWARCQRPSQAV